MAESTSPKTSITKREFEALMKVLSKAELDLLRDLVREGEPQEAVRLVEVMHHLQARLVDDEHAL